MRAGFQDERVDGTVAQSPVRQTGPLVRLFRLVVGPTDNQVDAGVGEAGAHQIETPRRLVRRVAPPHLAQDGVVQRLHAHGNARHAARGQFRQQRLRHIQRMQFDGEFRTGRQVRRERGEQGPQIA